jgi:hypothetical protein
MLNLPNVAYYGLFYILMLIIAVVGLSLHSIPPDVGIAMISFVMGHGSGLFSPPPGKEEPLPPLEEKKLP